MVYQFYPGHRRLTRPLPGPASYNPAVPWIRQIPVSEATGLLRRQFDHAMARAGRVWHIVHVMSLNPQAMRDSIAFYRTIMMGESPLSRVQRELLATVVSAELQCHY
jgi:alkylhydroperoxidase family enzyme